MAGPQLAKTRPIAPARIRSIILEQSKRANVGHIGSALSIADIVAALYGRVFAGLDPDDLAAGSLDTMKFGSEGSSKSKAWKDIWGSGQGIGVVDRVRPVAEYVDLLAEQYSAAKARICAS